MTKYLTTYITRCGGPPREEIEPTAEQMGALSQVLSTGAAPSVDFSLWGPHMKRALKKLQHSASLFDPNTGRWVQKSLRGPPNFDTWLKCWQVFKVAMIMLEQAHSASLDLYEAKVRECAIERFPACWFLTYQAESRTRSEFWDRLLRATELENTRARIPDYDSKMPWDYIIRKSVSDESTKAVAWWTKELTDKCTGYLTRTLTYDQVIADGSTLLVSGEPPQGAKRQAENLNKWNPKQPKRNRNDNQLALSQSTAIAPSVPQGHHGLATWWQSDQTHQAGQQGWPNSKGDTGKGNGKDKGKGKGKQKGKGKGKGKDKGKGKGKGQGKNK